jgi:hypothetical protein
VVGTIKLDGKGVRGPVEVDNEAADGMLSPKLQSGEGATAQGGPQLCFDVGRVAAEGARKLSLLDEHGGHARTSGPPG